MHSNPKTLIDLWCRATDKSRESAIPRPEQRSRRRLPFLGLFLPRSTDVLVSSDRISEQISLVLRAWGMSEEHIPIAAKMMLYADLRGIDSHGIGMLPTYRCWRGKGWINFQPSIRVERESPTTALIDGDGSLGHVPSHMAMKLAIAKCRKTGLGAVAVRNSSHFGAAGAYASLATDEGLIGMATTSAPSRAIVPTFGLEPMFGTNPLAFAAPARRNPPFLLDMATSTVAIGKITLALRRHRRLPRGWAVDEHGRPLTNPKTAASLHLMTPLGYRTETGGHKGYGLAAMVEILSAVLSGTGARRAPDAPNPTSRAHRVGHFFLALDPAMYREAGGFLDDMDGMIDALHGSKRADPHQSVLVAGDPEHMAYTSRTVDGIPLSTSLIGQLREVVREADVPFLLDGGSTS